jgi:hypothetical protein
LVASAIVTLAVELVRLPNWSSSTTSTAGAMAVPACVVEGWTRKASWVGVVAAVTSKAALVPSARPAELAASV